MDQKRIQCFYLIMLNITKGIHWYHFHHAFGMIRFSTLHVTDVAFDAVFTFLFEKIILCSFKTAKWLPYRQKLVTRLTICSLCNLSIHNSSNFPFGFKSRSLIVSVPIHCLQFTFLSTRPITKNSPVSEQTVHVTELSDHAACSSRGWRAGREGASLSFQVAG